MSGVPYHANLHYCCRDIHKRFCSLVLNQSAYNLQDSTLPGVTGTLRLDGARLVRESDWAVFRNGEAIPVPRVGEGRVDSTQY